MAQPKKIASKPTSSKSDTVAHDKSPSIALKKAQVFKYKSINDSSPVEINQTTVLVGKNESGKTAFLEALYKALPLGKAAFDPVFDYPKTDFIKYRPRHSAGQFDKVVELTFGLSEALIAKINEGVFHGASVLKQKQTFTRSTHYGNGNTICLSFDHAAAIAALAKPLEDLEHAGEVFANVKTLAAAVEAIESRKLPADSRLAQFATEWRSRCAKATTGWDMIGWHVWTEYLQNVLPQCLYFDDYNLLEGKINLEGLHQRSSQNQLSEADRTALGLFELAGIELQELMSDEGYETSKAKLEAIGLSISSQVFEFWKQNRELAVEFDIKNDPSDRPPFNTGKNLYIRIKNQRHGVTMPFDQRSKGFIWFFSFMVWFSAIENRAGTDHDVILLLDEPGLSLHALAQADFLAYIAKLSETRQIIYTTHSPFMVESDHLENVRVVEDRPTEGTKVVGELHGSSNESLFPLQAALGYSIAQNLFIADKNVLVEGPADLLILQHVSSLLEQKENAGLAEGVYVPVGGLDKLCTFVALLGANRLKLVVLHDRSASPHQGLEDLVHQKLIEGKRVLDFGMFRTPDNQETDIEDLVPTELYLRAFNHVYSGQLGGRSLAATDLGQQPRLVQKIDAWLAANEISLLKKGGFNHYRVAQALLPMMTGEAMSPAALEPFKKLFARVNALFA